MNSVTAEEFEGSWSESRVCQVTSLLEPRPVLISLGPFALTFLSPSASKSLEHYPSTLSLQGKFLCDSCQIQKGQVQCPRLPSAETFICSGHSPSGRVLLWEAEWWVEDGPLIFQRFGKFPHPAIAKTGPLLGLSGSSIRPLISSGVSHFNISLSCVFQSSSNSKQSPQGKWKIHPQTGIHLSFMRKLRHSPLRAVET